MYRNTVPGAGVAVALLAAAAVGGCGGGSSFTGEADAVCKDTTVKLERVPRPKTKGAFAVYLDRASAIAHSARRDLGAIKPPSDKKAEYQAYLAALERQLGIFDGARAVAHSGKTARALVILSAGQTSGRAVKARAKALGLNECSK